MKRKTSLAAALLASVMFAAPVIAEEAHHPDKAPAAQAPVPPLKPMQDNIRKMQGQLERLGKAKTADERQKLLAEHMRTMQENMSMARSMQSGMMNCPMMQGSMMGQGMGMMHPGAAGAEDMMTKRMEMMEKRMDMMQMMLQGRTGMQPGETATPGK